jgi:hypothetical protein
MKKFILLLLIFLLPAIIFVGVIEYDCRTNTVFSFKKKYFERNYDKIELMFIGSSHTQNAINPEFIERKSCNMAFGAQPMSIDYYLLDKYIDKMPKLSTVFLEVSHHRFYVDLNPNDWNGHIYSNLYDIYYNVEKYSIKNYSFLASENKFFTSAFFKKINPTGYKYKLNEFGFIVNDSNDRFSKLKYDTIKINNSFVLDFRFNSKYKKLNEEFLNRTVQLLQRKNIKVVLFSPPLYKTFYNAIPVDVKAHFDSTINSVKNRYLIDYLNYIEDQNFGVHDYKNDNHLNSDGAKKLCININNALISNTRR